MDDDDWIFPDKLHHQYQHPTQHSPNPSVDQLDGNARTPLAIVVVVAAAFTFLGCCCCWAATITTITTARLPQLLFQTLHIPEFPHFEYFIILNRVFGGPHPGHGLLGGWIPEQRPDVFSREPQTTKALVVFHHHAVNFAMILGQTLAHVRHHARQSVVPDPIKACV